MSTITTVTLADLFDPAELAIAMEQGYVRQQSHPSLPLVILNYTERAQYERAWNPVTLQCRGLITDTAGRVVARPFAKFFNYGEHPEGSLELMAPAEVTDKLDGSLGIMYPSALGWAIATRGSFTSDQAQHATNLLAERYPDFEPPDGMTVLFEIVYPANRIVVDYQGTDDLILLGAVDIVTGESVGPPWLSGWDGPAAATFEARCLADALALPPRKNAEGIVVRLTDADVRVKIKQDDYVALHRLVTGLNARVVWERLGDGETAADICAALPDEFHGWVREVADELLHAQAAITDAATAAHRQLSESLPAGWTRKDYAIAAQKSQYRPWLFMLLDGKDPAAKIWRTLRPSGERTLVAHGEDVA